MNTKEGRVYMSDIRRRACLLTTKLTISYGSIKDAIAFVMLNSNSLVEYMKHLCCRLLIHFTDKNSVQTHYVVTPYLP